MAAVDELSLGELAPSEISFSQPTSSDVDLFNLPNIKDSVPVFSVNDTKLNVLHSLSGWNHVPYLVKILWI
jgi:hypothetical protein